jgi:hypothetical protein
MLTNPHGKSSVRTCNVILLRVEMLILEQYDKITIQLFKSDNTLRYCLSIGVIVFGSSKKIQSCFFSTAIESRQFLPPFGERNMIFSP